MNNPLKYTDPSGYVYQGPVEPTAPMVSRAGMSYQEDYNRVVYNPFGGVGFDYHNSFDKAYKSSQNQIGFSRRIQARNLLLSIQRNTYTFTNVGKVVISGNFIYVSSSPPQKKLFSNMQLLYNEVFGIYVQRDKWSGEFYQPYSDRKVDPGALLYNAKLEAFLKSTRSEPGHGAANGGDEPEVVAEGIISYANLVPGAGFSVMGGTLNYKEKEYGVYASGFSWGPNLGIGIARIKVLANPETFSITHLMNSGYQADFGASIISHSRSSSNIYEHDFEIRTTGIGYSYPFVGFSITPFGKIKIVEPGRDPSMTDLYRTRPGGY